MRRILLLVAAFALMGCSAMDPVSSAVHSAAPASTNTSCRDLLVRSLSSKEPIKGAFACLSPNLQAEAAMQGVTNDDDLAANATMPPVYAGIHLLGRGPSSAYEYQLQADGTPMFLFVWVAPDGKVNGVRIEPAP